LYEVKVRAGLRSKSAAAVFVMRDYFGLGPCIAPGSFSVKRAPFFKRFFGSLGTSIGYGGDNNALP